MRIIKIAALLIIAAIVSNSVKAQVIYNNTALTVQSGLNLTVGGDLLNAINGSINNAGTFSIMGNWTNNAANGALIPGAGLVEFFAPATIGGSDSTVFYDIVLNMGPTDVMTVTTASAGNVGLIVDNTLSLGMSNLNLNSRELIINNGAPTALVAGTGAIETDIIDNSPNPNYSIINWGIGSNTGLYTVPFITGMNQSSIPLLYTVTAAGDVGGRVLFSQYATNYLNTPLPDAPTVTSMLINGLSAEEDAANRFWRIDASSYTTQPAANIQFGYEQPDLCMGLTCSSYIDETNMVAYQWDNTNSVWNPVYFQGSVNQLNDTYDISGVSQSNSWWTLASACAGFQVDLGADTISCAGPIANLVATPSGTNASVTYAWSPTDSLSCTNCASPTTDVNYSTTYVVTATDGNGCIATDSVHVLIAATTFEICMVTVDSTSSKNEIAWEKPFTTAIDSFYIYRLDPGLGQYLQVGTVDYDSLSVYVDNEVGVNPNQQQYFYKISSLDTCGVESPLSTFHRTIHLNAPLVSSTVDLSWETYFGIIGVYSYEIYRDSVSIDNSNWEQIGIVGSGSNVFTDLTPPLNMNTTRYEIRIALPNGGCTSTKAQSFGNTRSNRKTIIGGGGGNAPVADFAASFTSLIEGQSIDFADLSTNTPTSWSWTFTGGSPFISTIQSPTGIVYNVAGSYDVSLTATNADGSNTQTKVGYIVVGPNGINESDITSLLVFPNPTTGIINIHAFVNESKNISIRVMNTVGEIIINEKVSVSSGMMNYEIDLSSVAKGIYHLEIISEKGVAFQKILKH